MIVSKHLAVIKHFYNKFYFFYDFYELQMQVFKYCCRISAINNNISRYKQKKKEMLSTKIKNTFRVIVVTTRQFTIFPDEISI